jgi:hypothetical protein
MLYPYLIIVNDKYELRVTPYKDNKISPMHERENPFPATVKQEYTNPEEAIEGLEALTDYYAQTEKKQRTGGTTGATSKKAKPSKIVIKAKSSKKTT